MKQQERFRCTIMRGGTSKGIYIMRNELPQDPEVRDRIILAIFGSPDIRQVDGLGGADLLTSKVAIIGPSSRADADVDYTFGQVGITEAKVDYTGNCGNISSGVGPFTIIQGLVDAVEPITKVRIHMTNTKKVLAAEVPVKDGAPVIEGHYHIDGCPGTGAKITMDWSDTGGAVTGKILPTGHAKDVLNVGGMGQVTVSIVDAGNPIVFIQAESLDMKGTENPFEIDGDAVLLGKLERIRSAAAARLGFVKDWRKATKQSQYAPFITMVNSPKNYVDYTTGKTIKADSFDIMARLLFNQRMHKTYPGSGTVCTGTAARIPGTIVNEFLSKSAKNRKEVRIGHPAGVIPIEVEVKMEGRKPILRRAAIGRTARIIMEGYVFVRKDLIYGSKK
ncbi:MAG: PrpF domain-containing protein [Thermodesulfobacteriota bacterium]|nr:PrpF domain-containing protein [Thermodesulfobacteriota bacterium]